MRCAQLALLALTSTSCAGFRPPEPFEMAPVRDRMITMTRSGIRASAALLTPEQVEAVFAVDLAAKEIEPVWLEIENETQQPVYLLLTGIDPEYFSPFEVSRAFHRKFRGSANDLLDRHVTELAFPNRPPILPGETASGFVFTNQSERIKVVDIDLVGDQWTSNITLFVPDPVEGESDLLADLANRFSEPELVELGDDEELREALEGLPCCVQDAEGRHVAPLNMVFLGPLDQWMSAGMHRGYRERRIAPLFAFRREQDLAAARREKWVEAQSHSIRLWQTPLRFDGHAVWMALASMPRGGRFASDPGSPDPFCDRARDDVLTDLMYSQSLAQVGFTLGGGCVRAAEAGVSTDGLRAVLRFAERNISLDEIDFFDWERLADYR